MELEKLKTLLLNKEVMVESRWELIEIDSVGSVKEISKLNKLLVIILDNDTKIVCQVDEIQYENDDTVNFIHITPDKDEIITFRIKII
ncbi:hypothetical protein [uncultured Ilyobacter sp.]|jgi:hypothetical protein|uniref:hypothetical protein n=1 Tax=uncultured Ilyobacter sp. TaxID=544433 RepID=UPI0029C0AF14|nr:hypothetical protein [uncultured Ilyobacter sp.]